MNIVGLQGAFHAKFSLSDVFNLKQGRARRLAQPPARPPALVGALVHASGSGARSWPPFFDLKGDRGSDGDACAATDAA